MDFLVIGTIINTHGLKGEVKIESYSDFDDIRYQKGKVIYIVSGDEYIPATVRSYRVHKGFPLVAFEEFPTINEVEKFKTCDVCITRSDRHELPEGEYYADELVGMLAVDEDGNEIGKVVSVEPTIGAQNNLRVERDGQKDALIPNVPFFVKEIDAVNGRIVIHTVEGLL